jgi:hypothetical protein
MKTGSMILGATTEKKAFSTLEKEGKMGYKALLRRA